MAVNEDATARVAISRIGKACDRCRVKKVRCSGDVPCTRCSKDGTDCRFGERSQKKNLSADYASLLEHQGLIMEQAVKTAWQRWIPESEQGSLGANPTLPAIMEHLGISGPDNSNGRIVYHHDAAGSPDQSPSSSSRSQNSTSKANRKSRKGSTSQMPNGERIFSSPPQDDEADHLPQTWSPSFAIDESSPGAYNMVPDLSFATSPTSFSDPSYSRAGTVHPFHMTQGNSPTHWDNPFDVPMNGMSSTMPAPPSNAFGDQAYNQDGFTRGPPLRSSSMSGYKLPIYARRPAARPIAFTRGFHIDMSQMPKVLIESQSRESKTPSTTHDTAQFVQQPGPSHVMYPQLSR